MYSCDQCEYKASNTTQLEAHTKTIHLLSNESTELDFDKVYYNCDKCDYKAGDVTLVETHIEKIHMESIQEHITSG